jgi:hypothetical protein
VTEKLKICRQREERGSSATAFDQGRYRPRNGPRELAIASRVRFLARTRWFVWSTL